MATNCYGIDCAGWKMLHPRASIDHLGLVPAFLYETDPRPACEQFNERYEFGGWRPIKGFTKGERDALHYPDDPELEPIAQRMFRDEKIVMYRHSLIAIVQPDGAFEVARLD